MRSAIITGLALGLLAVEALAQHHGGRSGHSSFGSRSSSSSRSSFSSSSRRASSGGARSAASAPARPTRVAPRDHPRPTPSPGVFVAPDAVAVEVSPAECRAVAVLPLRYTDPSVPAGVAAFGLSFALLGGLVVLLTRKRAPRGFAPVPAPFAGCDLRRVTLGFDAAARPALQAALAGIAARHDPAEPAARRRSLVEAAECLRAHLASARYACVQSGAMSEEAAAGAFERLAADLRGRYVIEAVANQRTIAATATASAEEGPGMLVATLLVASTEDLAELPGATPSEALAGLAPSRGEYLVGYELIWSPVHDGDRMSSAELEARYPDLVKIDPASAFGRARCDHCGAVFAREIGRCPGCGAPPVRA